MAFARKKQLFEYLAPECKILEEKIDEATKERVMRVEVKWQHAGRINGNKRFYKDEILKREVERLKPLMAEGKVYGCAYHPVGDSTLNDVSHLWEDAWVNDDGSCEGIVKILPTDKGKNAQILIRNGGHIGISSRGFGSVRKEVVAIEGKEQEAEVVLDDFQLESPGDFVLTPSVPDAGVLKVLESRLKENRDNNKIENGDEDKMKTLEQLREEAPEVIGALEKEIEDKKTELATLSAKVEEMSKSQAEASKKIEELTTDLTAVKEQQSAAVCKIRDVLTVLSAVPGVVEEIVIDSTENTDTQDKKEDRKEDVMADIEKVKKEAEEKVKAAEEKAKEIEDKIKELEAKEQFRQNLDAVLKEEKAEERLAIEEAVRALNPLPTTIEAIKSELSRIKEEMSRKKIEEQKDKIREGGLGEKGIIEDADKRDTEALKNRWYSALKAGYRGSFEEYVKTAATIK